MLEEATLVAKLIAHITALRPPAMPKAAKDEHVEAQKPQSAQAREAPIPWQRVAEGRNQWTHLTV